MGGRGAISKTKKTVAMMKKIKENKKQISTLKSSLTRAKHGLELARSDFVLRYEKGDRDTKIKLDDNLIKWQEKVRQAERKYNDFVRQGKRLQEKYRKN